MRVRLGDVCTVVSGSTPKTAVPEYWDGDIDWITPAELTDDTYVINESVRKITWAAVEKTGLKPFPAGTVILSSRAPIGKVAIAGKEMYCNQGFKNLVCGDKIRPAYLYWLLRGKTDYLNSLGRGATFKEISKSIVENIVIPLPPMDVQADCADTLKKVADLILLRKRQLAELDTLVKARFAELFGDPVTNPRGWDFYNFLDLGTCKNGMNFHYDDKGVEINCLGVGDFKDYSTISNTAQLSKISLNELPTSEYLLKDDDLVFVRSNGNKALVGRCVAVYPGNIPTTFSGFCIRYRLGTNRVIVPYILHAMKTDPMRRKMAGRGANIQNLNQQTLGTLKIPVPPLALQNQFADFIRETEKTRAAVRRGLAEAERLFASLMQEYFS